MFICLVDARGFPANVKRCPERQRFYKSTLLAVVLVLALLICNAAGGLASRLAGGLALAASAVLNCVVEILGFDSLDSVHNKILRI